VQHSSKQYVSLGCEYAIPISLLADGEIRRRGTCRLVCFGYRLFDGDCWSNERNQARAAVCNSSTWLASSKNLLSVFQKLTYPTLQRTDHTSLTRRGGGTMSGAGEAWEGIFLLASPGIHIALSQALCYCFAGETQALN
jgi:hypothetical protein